MAYTLSNTCAKNLCKWTVLVQLIIRDVVTCLFETQYRCNPEMKSSSVVYKIKYRNKTRTTKHCKIIYTVNHKKIDAHSTFIHNFEKCWTLLKIILLLNSAVNLQ